MLRLIVQIFNFLKENFKFKKKIQLMIEKYFKNFFINNNNNNRSWQRHLNSINLKLRELKWTKAKLEN